MRRTTTCCLAASALQVLDFVPAVYYHSNMTPQRLILLGSSSCGPWQRRKGTSGSSTDEVNIYSEVSLEVETQVNIRLIELVSRRPGTFKSDSGVMCRLHVFP